MTRAERNRLIAAIKKATAKARSQDKKPWARRIDPKAKAIADHIESSDFGCKKESVRKLMELATGLKLPETAKASGHYDISVLMAFVTKNGDFGCFGDNETVVVTRVTGSTGEFENENNLDEDMYADKSELRPATDAEINALSDKTLVDLLKKVILV